MTSWPCCRRCCNRWKRSASSRAISIRRISIPSWRPPARRIRSCGPIRSRLADWPEQFASVRNSLEAASDAALAAFTGLREVQHGNGDMIAVFRALRYAAARPGGALSACRKTAAGKRFLRRSSLARRCRAKGAARRTCQGEHRDHPRPQRARQPRRLLALCAGILHARPRLAAGDGAARRQRQRPRLPVELAARRAQPRRHPGGADGNRQYLGPDG